MLSLNYLDPAGNMGEEFLESEVVFADPHDQQFREEDSPQAEGWWSRKNNQHCGCGHGSWINHSVKRKRNKRKKKKITTPRSLPINIPAESMMNSSSSDSSSCTTDLYDYNSSSSSTYYYYDEDDFEDQEEEEASVRIGGGFGDNERTTIVVPPHLIVARRIAARMASSVFAHSARPLRGRDLFQVRNSILRMTGFLET